jgi:pimeloyl-[acyl-carrier protein] methyl ester esterase
LFARGDPSPATLAQSLAFLAQIDLRNEVRAVQARCLVVTGNRDTLAPAAAGAWLAQALPDARLLEIDGAGHAPFLSHRDTFLAALAEFLDG